MKLLLRTIITATFTLSLLLTTGVMAQTATTGTIEGAVTDIHGAVVPRVTITVTSPNLIRAQSVTSDNEGRYRILNLPPGRYAVIVEATGGFARFVKPDVEVNLSKTLFRGGKKVCLCF